MSSKADHAKLVVALYTFRGKNNDELCFRKGDVITITQMDDGGWWEGTLNEKTGWFPSNYVKECKAPESTGCLPIKSSPEKVTQELSAQQKANRGVVLKDIIDSERVNVAELQGLVNNFLQPLETTSILTREEYKQLVGNIHDVVEVHQHLLSNLEAAFVQGPDARAGSFFLALAPRLKSIHIAYCASHPRAVCILDRFRDELNEFMERSGAVSPGILVLTTGLSKPFRRFEKYSTMLQELERHMEKNHPDRGDTQRSVCVYREIAERCSAIRKQKELALTVLAGGIKGWEGEDLHSLGDIIYVGPVTLATGMDRRDRYFVLFSTTLLVLSTSQRMSSFIYEGKLPLTGIGVTKVDDTEEMKNGFEISGPMIESIIAVCPSREERQQWIEYLTQEQHANVTRSPTASHVSYSSLPYVRLSKYFAKLVRRKVIYTELLKKLLYCQYIFKPDLSEVKMRKCTVTYTIYPSRYDSCSDDGSTDSNSIAIKHQPRHKSSLKLDVTYKLWDNDESSLGTGFDQGDTESTSSFICHDVKSSEPEHSRLETSRSVPNVTLKCPASGPSTEFVRSAIEIHDVDGMSNAAASPITLDRTRNIQQRRNCKEQRCDCWNSTMKNWKRTELFQRDREVEAVSMTEDYRLERGHEDEVTTVGNETDFRLPQFHSTTPRSSDSGMADSCHLNSSDLNSSYKSYRHSRGKGEGDAARISHSESENDENKFEHQCICSSPFGSTPRESLRDASSSEKLNANVVPPTPVPSIAFEKFCIVRGEDSNPEQTVHPDNSATVTSELVIRGRDQKHLSEPIPRKEENISKKSRRGCIQRRHNAEDQPSEQIYTSGLYAHWWLKKKIPMSGNTDQGKLPWHGCFTILHTYINKS